MKKAATNLFLFKLSIQSVQVQVSAVDVAAENEQWNAQNQMFQCKEEQKHFHFKDHL